MDKLTHANNGLLLHGLNRLIDEVNELRVEIEKLSHTKAITALVDPNARIYVDEDTALHGKVD